MALGGAPRSDVPRIVEVELVLAAAAVVGEGPVWDSRASVLRWVDIPQGTVHALDPATGRDDSVSLDRMVGAVALRATGGLVVGAQGGFFALDSVSGAVELLAELPGAPAGMRMNDGKCDPSGRFWAANMALDASPNAGTLYSLEVDGTIEERLSELTIPNGIDWSPDGRTMYYVDSPTHRIDAFDFDPGTGALDRRRVLAHTDPAVLPDGMTVDAHGYCWVALWGGWAVHRYAPDGTLDTVVRVPASQVSSCCFGGPELSDLYITTASGGLDEAALAREPDAGAIFVCRPGVSGRSASLVGC